MLTKDGRASYSDMSKQIGVSVSTVRNRVTNMRESGVLHLTTRTWSGSASTPPS